MEAVELQESSTEERPVTIERFGPMEVRGYSDGFVEIENLEHPENVADFARIHPADLPWVAAALDAVHHARLAGLPIPEETCYDSHGVGVEVYDQGVGIYSDPFEDNNAGMVDLLGEEIPWLAKTLGEVVRRGYSWLAPQATDVRGFAIAAAEVER